MFGRTYLELLGLFGDDDSADPWNIQSLLGQYEVLHGLSFGCEDITVVNERLRQAGLSPSGVVPL